MDDEITRYEDDGDGPRVMAETVPAGWERCAGGIRPKASSVVVGTTVFAADEPDGHIGTSPTPSEVTGLTLAGHPDEAGGLAGAVLEAVGAEVLWQGRVANPAAAHRVGELLEVALRVVPPA